MAGNGKWKELEDVFRIGKRVDFPARQPCGRLLEGNSGLIPFKKWNMMVVDLNRSKNSSLLMLQKTAQLTWYWNIPHFFSRKYIFMMMVLFSSQLMLVYRRVSQKFAANLSFRHWLPSGHPPAGVYGWMALRKFAEECISYMFFKIEEIPSSNNRSG